MNKKIWIILAVAAMLALALVIGLLLASRSPAAPESDTPNPGTAAPSQTPTDPAQTPTTPSEEPTESAEEPSEPVAEPTVPAEEPTEPEEGPTAPEEEPTAPPQKPDKPTEEKPDQPTEDPEPSDEDIANAQKFAEYLAMSGQEQEEFADSFHSLTDFVQWYHEARDAYEKLYPGIEIDDQIHFGN